MRGSIVLKTGLLGLALTFAATVAMSGQVVSTMRNVDAVMSTRGYSLAPAADASGKRHPGDLAPTQAFEIIRPNGQAVTLGRLYTSCTCVRLESSSKTFGRGERAVLELRNVIATPTNGQRYAIYVQITSPIRATLRYDTFVKSDFGNPSGPVSATIATSGGGSETIQLVPVESKPADKSASAATAAKAEEKVEEKAATVAKAEEKAAPAALSSSAAPTTSNHPFMSVGGGEGGIELIVPKWDPEVDGKGKGAAAKPAEPAEKAEPAAQPALSSSVAYSKELKIEDAAPAEKKEIEKAGEKEPEAKEPAATEPEAKEAAAPGLPTGVVYDKELRIEDLPTPAEPVKELKITEIVSAGETAEKVYDEAVETAKSAEEKALEVDAVIDKYMSTYKRDSGHNPN